MKNDHRLGFPPTVENTAMEDSYWVDPRPYPLGIPKRLWQKPRETVPSPIHPKYRSMKFINTNTTHSDYMGMRAMGFTPPEEKNFIKPVPERIIGQEAKPKMTASDMIDAYRYAVQSKLADELDRMRMTPEQYFRAMKMRKTEEAEQLFLQDQKYLRDMAKEIAGMPAIYKGAKGSIACRAQETCASASTPRGQAAPCAALRS